MWPKSHNGKRVVPCGQTDRQTAGQTWRRKSFIAILWTCLPSCSHYIDLAGSRCEASDFYRNGSALNPGWKRDCLTPGFPQSLQVNALILLQSRRRQLPSPSFPFQQAFITLPLEYNDVHKTPTDRAARDVSVSQRHPHTYRILKFVVGSSGLDPSLLTKGSVLNFFYDLCD